ncbi:P1 family peptidase [Syntrophobacter fumaroxidans]|uniref:Peptidase S58, DmpA n=1 Tax=Syntrophobacter fumaroxidans (strain DSM 10017 / MPOB) TaxID=335543 RepID=A0LNB7_SYNFM|nr:P1 family peptidase [Syntrophobacter fumaroxidans]ABK18919.1 peptidase S58, DmpA [Syntrophobacter fumaroxidans MPOB]
MKNDTLTAIDGIRVGHAELDGIPSGCTVVLPGGGAIAGVDVRGGAPGTYGTDAFYPLNLVDQVHGLFFTGGSAFGHNVAGGVRQYLRERNLGFDTGHGLVPIVAGAVIFDLSINRSAVYPDAALGYAACVSASTDPVAEGNTGAGRGATVGKLYGIEQAMAGGVGSACVFAARGVRVGALFVVNAFGDVVDPDNRKILAGTRKDRTRLELVDSDAELMRIEQFQGFPDGQATVVGVVATNVKCNKTQLTKVAQMAHDGMARTVYPAHTMHDGDAIFALSVGEIKGVEVSIVGALAARATAEAIIRAVRNARALDAIPCHSDL